MLQLAVSAIRGVTLVAAVVPGAHFLTDAMENAFQGNDVVHDLFDSIGKLLENAAEIFAKIGNAIGVDNLAGVGEDKLKGSDFINGGGIIPKVLSNLFTHAPDAVSEFSKNPSSAIIPVGATVALMAADPKLASALHDEGVKGASTVVNVARQASQGAATAAQFTGEMANKLPNGGAKNAIVGVTNAAVRATTAAQTGFSTIGEHTGRLEKQINQRENLAVPAM